MTANHRLDLTKVQILPFCRETAVNQFDCGKRPINQFIKNKAKKCDRHYEHKVFCARYNESRNCIGYYALQVGSDSVSELPSAKSYIQNYVAFPVVHLSYLGVHEPYRRQGLGEYLLMDVFSKVTEIAKYVGFYALTLQSLDDDSTAFYKSLGFVIYSENLKQPKMLYPLADILTLVNSNGKASG